MFWDHVLTHRLVKKTVEETTKDTTMPRRTKVDSLQVTLEEKQQELIELAEQLKEARLKAAIEKDERHKAVQKKMDALREGRWRLRADLAKKHLSISCKERDLAALKQLIGELQKKEAEMTAEHEELARKAKAIEENIAVKMAG